MIAAQIARKEVLLVRRDKRFRAIVIAVLLVMLAAVSLGAARTATFERERVNALAQDREVWLDQGPRNPHAAAHFSRYAFKPIPPLAAIDPGVIDYAGLAIWMEAHRRNPATFRYAEGGSALSRFATLSPAWVLQTLVPLVIILLLFASYSGEREDGTLRQLLGSGATGAALFSGKLRGAGQVLLWILVPLVAITTIAVFGSGAAQSQPDQGLRLVLLLACYSLYLFAITMVTIGLSALCPNRRSSAVTLFAFWFVIVVLVPRLAGDIAVVRAPQPNALEITTSLRNIGMSFWESDELREQAEQRVLERYGADTREKLPISYDAYELQASEEYADPLFAEVYADLDAVHSRQDGTLGMLTALSPRLAMARLSAGLAGTDRLHHVAFAQEAEMHRRKIIKQMNDDMMINGAEDGYGYQSEESFWATIADYQGSYPKLQQFLPAYVWAMIALTAWALLSFLFARSATARAGLLETAK